MAWETVGLGMVLVDFYRWHHMPYLDCTLSCAGTEQIFSVGESSTQHHLETVPSKACQVEMPAPPM